MQVHKVPCVQLEKDHGFISLVRSSTRLTAMAVYSFFLAVVNPALFSPLAISRNDPPPIS